MGPLCPTQGSNSSTVLVEKPFVWARGRLIFFGDEIKMFRCILGGGWNKMGFWMRFVSFCFCLVMFCFGGEEMFWMLEVG